MKYYITGNTYEIKDELLALGCTWVPQKRCWQTMEVKKESPRLERIYSVSNAIGAKLVPLELNDECRKIQDILNK